MKQWPKSSASLIWRFDHLISLMAGDCICRYPRPRTPRKGDDVKWKHGARMLPVEKLSQAEADARMRLRPLQHHYNCV